MSAANRARRAAAALALLMAATGAALAQPPAAPASAAKAPLPRQPDGHPDLQGLWIKSAGGFQGLFIGSLDGTLWGFGLPAQ